MRLVFAFPPQKLPTDHNHGEEHFAGLSPRGCRSGKTPEVFLRAVGVGPNLLWCRLAGDDYRVCYRGEDGQCDGGGGGKKSDKSVATFYFLTQM